MREWKQRRKGARLTELRALLDAVSGKHPDYSRLDPGLRRLQSESLLQKKRWQTP